MVVRGKGEMVGVVQEYHMHTLDALLSDLSSNLASLSISTHQLMFDLLNGLHYLHSKGIGKIIHHLHVHSKAQRSCKTNA